MPYRDPEYVQKKIELIEKGLPIDISDAELSELEKNLRGARSFYVDILQAFLDRKATGEDVESSIVEESKNIANVEVALRKIDDFRVKHGGKITDSE